jgi:exonuclease SbcC
MRMLRLTVAGFGPFRDEQVIDFERCNIAGLFTVTGQTGSGKTSLLDAIAFALYGETTGSGQGTGESDGRTASDVRCTACTPKDPTFVELDFRVGDQSFRVRRNPRYERAAKRGDGATTQEAASAEIYRLAGGQPSLVQGIRTVQQASAFIERQVGLTAEQFRRVVVIPQGRFREVLLSSPQERLDLLKRIFGTQVYERFTDLVKSHASGLRQEAEQLSRDRAEVVKSLPWADGLGLAETRDRAKELHEEAAKVVSDLARDLELFGQSRIKAVQAHDAAKSGNDLVATREKEESQFAAAQLALGAIAPLAAELAAAQRVEAAAMAMERESEARDRHDDANKKLREADEAVGPLFKSRRQAGDAFIMARGAREATEQDLLPKLGGIKTEMDSLATAKARQSDLSGNLDRLREDLVHSNSACEVADAAEVRAQQALQSAQEKLGRARENQRASRAGLLARELMAGCACPVCGSLTHPLPASAADAIDDAAIKDLERVELDARTKLGEAADVVSEARLRKNKVAGEIQAAEGELERMRGDGAGVDLDQQIRILVDRGAALQTDLDDVRRKAKELQEAADLARKFHEEAAQKRDAAMVRSGSCLEELKRATEQLAEEMAKIPSIDAVGVAEAKRLKQWIDDAGRKVSSVRSAFVRAEGAVGTARSIAGSAIRCDLGPLKADVNVWQGKHDDSKRQHDAKLVEADRLERLCAQFDALFARSEDIERRFRPAHELQQVIMGTNAEARVSLHSWVLGAFLDEVLAVASRRMSDLTRGRYELRRMEGQLDGRQEAGLNIEVFDSHAGTSRPARTLSGGETFLASLSMALALAEVAGAKGGQPLDTVFIDEGFGSLDSETLDVAMGVLQRLRESGRTVGLISHVEEMKRRIPAGIDVVKDPASGTSRVVQPSW